MTFKIGVRVNKSKAYTYYSQGQSSIKDLSKKISSMNFYPPRKAKPFEVFDIIKTANKAYLAMKQGASSRNVDWFMRTW